MSAPLTAGAALIAAVRRLKEAGVDSARLDARLLLATVLGIEPIQVVARPEREMTGAEQERFLALLARRERREPMAHITGRREFWSLSFSVTADTLDPRPDSETVIEAVLAAMPDRKQPMRVLDFGTGTGCLLLAVLSEYPAATGLGIDRSEAALAVARANASALELAQRAEFAQGDWGSGLHGLFNVILSNPPYIPDDDIAGLEAEVAAYEPWSALAGGPDGLDCYRALAPDIARLLAPGGIAVLEVGQGQAADVTDILRKAGLVPQGVRRDLGGVERCVLATR